jgi:rhodanese-related sulfurtransferase
LQNSVDAYDAFFLKKTLRRKIPVNEFNIEPEHFNEMLLNNEIIAANIIDVRELPEWHYYHLDGTEHIPMNTIPERLGELSRDETLYVICAHGVRSAAVCNYMLQQGFTQIKNVEGGMSAIAELRGFSYD